MTGILRLILALGLIGAVSGGGALHRVAEEAQALAEIKEYGGTVTLNAKGRVVEVDLHTSKISDDGLEHLRRLSHLQSLNLACCKNVTNAGLKHLTGLICLQSLTLGGTQVTDEGLRNLEGLSHLRSLSLCGVKVTDSGLDHLRGLTNLRVLELQGTEVRGQGLRHLRELRQLQSLDLGLAGMEDVGLEYIKDLTRLQCLNLCDGKISDKGLEHLRRSKELGDAAFGRYEGVGCWLAAPEGAISPRIVKPGSLRCVGCGAEVH